MKETAISLGVKEAIDVTRKLARVNQLQQEMNTRRQELEGLVTKLMQKYKPEGMRYKDFNADEGVLLFEEDTPVENIPVEATPEAPESKT